MERIARLNTYRVLLIILGVTAVGIGIIMFVLEMIYDNQTFLICGVIVVPFFLLGALALGLAELMSTIPAMTDYIHDYLHESRISSDRQSRQILEQLQLLNRTLSREAEAPVETETDEHP